MVLSPHTNNLRAVITHGKAQISSGAGSSRSAPLDFHKHGTIATRRKGYGTVKDTLIIHTTPVYGDRFARMWNAYNTPPHNWRWLKIATLVLVAIIVTQI
jgi:hypothetical protein